MTSSHLPLSPPATPLRTHSGRPYNATRRKSAPGPPHNVRPNNASMSTTTSPEVITSLVESLSKISGPPNPSLYGAPPNVTPMFPSAGGTVRDVDYDYGRQDYPYHHPDEAALAPVVRTSKPPSGLSPLTNGSEDSKRMSYHAGVDIPSYVRNYMNRAEREESGHKSKDSYSSRRSRLSYVSSKERIKRNAATSASEGSVEGTKERELRMSASGVLSATSTGGGELHNKKSTLSTQTTDSDLPGGRQIPTRNSSHGKGTQRVVSYPAAIVTTVPPLLQTPLPSPTFQANGGAGGAAPAPGLSVPSKENKKQIKRRSSPPTLFSPNSFPSSNPQKSVKTSRHNSNPLPSPSYNDDRPSSADSIDDAVDSYLCSPRLSQKLRMPTTGRMISFSEVGDPNGFAVFCCVGMGLTRYVTAFYDELALTLGLRLITPDRPGVGESDGIEESARAVLNWPDDVLYICQSLKITKFSILAHSAGAIYALATALRMPGHIRGKIHLLAPWIPPSQMSAMEAQIAGAGGKGVGRVGTVPTTQRILRAIPTPILKVANSSFMSATSSSLTSSLPKSPSRRKRRDRDKSDLPGGLGFTEFTISGGAGGDLGRSPPSPTPGADGAPLKKSNTFSEDLSSEEAAMLRAAAIAAADKERQLTYEERLTHSIWQLATRGANPAVDLLVCLERTRPVGFRYVDITRPVVIHHGTRDNRVPVDNVRWLGKMMRKCEVRELRGEGHGLMASANVMGSVLEEIACEWREWKRMMDQGGEGRSRSGTVGTLGGGYPG